MISIQLQQLSRSYDHQIIFSNINLTHHSGILGIAGPNGSGKSTLLKCMAGLIQPNDGRIIWKNNNREVSGQSLRPILGFSAPYISLYKELTVRENLEFLARLRKFTLQEEELASLLELVELTHVGDQLFGHLSTGQQQRAKLASAIFHDPFALLLDEPGSNLDQNGRQLVERISQMFSTEGKLLIVASNNEQELALCDRIFSVEKETFI